MWWDKLIWVIQSRLEISFIIQHFALALSIVIVGYNIKLTKKSILCGGGVLVNFYDGDAVDVPYIFYIRYAGFYHIFGRNVCDHFGDIHIFQK